MAEAIGIGGKRFLSAYTSNLMRQSEESIKGSEIAETILELLKDMEKWEGKPSELLMRLVEVAGNIGINTRSKSWPKAPNVLSRRLNELRPGLQTFGISIDRGRGDNKRFIKLIKISSESSSLNDECEKDSKEDSLELPKSISEEKSDNDDDDDIYDNISEESKEELEKKSKNPTKEAG